MTIYERLKEETQYLIQQLEKIKNVINFSDIDDYKYICEEIRKILGIK